MSLPYPRRLKDLSAFQVDENEETKPQKTQEKSKSESKQSDKHEGQTKEGGSYNDSNQRTYQQPKRSSELPKLDSDSESDDSFKKDNLNCAILNDSFILSPCKNEQNENVAAETPAGKLLRKVEANRSDINDNLSFVAHFNNMILDSKQEATPEPPKRQPNSSSCINQSHKEKLEIIKENEQPEKENYNCLNDNVGSRRKAIETPYKSTANLGISTSTATKVTTNSTSDSQFATPQVRSFSMQKRPRDLCSSQKSRAKIFNEFRSQKVLFQTPISLSRVPLSCLPNDSVTLSLYDTINETGNTPNTAEKSPPKESKRESSEKSKKSLNSAFAATEQSHKHEKEHVDAQSTKKVPEDETEPSDLKAPSKASAESNKQTHLKINAAEYGLVRKLGCGGSSSVYLAQRLNDGKECALKVVDLRGDPLVVEGYMNETKLLAKLQGNVCVVSLFDYQLIQKESKLLVVMEKGDTDLQKILHGYTTNLPLYVLANYLYQMLQAVNYIHQNGVIHSDLKPANFLMVQGRLKLIDFGIASNIAIDSTSIIKFSQAGTFNYISPEALTDTSSGTSPIRHNQPKIKISTKSDVWSLGCILYLFLYKKTPFSHIKNVYAKITAISSPNTVIEFPSIPAYYPNMLVNMVRNCLQHNPKQRPSCADLLQYPFHMIIPIANLATTTQTNAAATKQIP